MQPNEKAGVISAPLEIQEFEQVIRHVCAAVGPDGSHPQGNLGGVLVGAAGWFEEEKRRER